MNPPPPRSTRTDALLPCPTRFRSLSVLVTVIGHRPAQGHVIVDGGWMARSRDRGTQDQPVDQGYGLALDLDQRPLGDVVMIAASQEHGVLARPGDGALDLGDYPVGRRFRILPNHPCAPERGSASCRESEGSYGEDTVVADSLKNKKDA